VFFKIEITSSVLPAYYKTAIFFITHPYLLPGSASFKYTKTEVDVTTLNGSVFLTSLNFNLLIFYLKFLTLKVV